MDQNNSFVFYRSFYDAMKLLDNDDKSDFIALICELAFNGVEADFTNSGYSDLVKIAYTISAEQIKASIQNKINGTKGGTQKGINNKKRGVNTPLNTPLNTNVNVNVKDNVKVNENDNVNIDPHTFIFLPIKDLLINNCAAYGLKVDKNALNSLLPKLEKISVTHDIEGVIKERLEYIFTKYKDKTDDEKKALFYKSFDWDSIPQKEETPKIKKVTDPRAPKVCTFCGSKLTKWAGVPNGYQCINCIGNGHKNTSWELIGDEYKCNRAS